MIREQQSEAIIRKACPSWAQLEGLTFHGWKVIKPIGRGGTAEVYLLQDAKKPQEQAALKLLLPEFKGNDESKKLFLREADLLDDLDHAGIPKMRLQTSIMDRLALVMDYIPGDNLMTLVHHKAQLPAFAAFIAASKIIAYLHENKIAHNDIKLANFILSPQGRLHCVDFGSARRLSLSSTFFRRLRAAEPLQGTASYLSPELIQGKSPSKASDVWALGILAHYLYTGSAPWQGSDTHSIVSEIKSHNAPSLRSRCAEVDAALSAIVDRCLIRDPQLRYPDAEEVLQLLRRYRDNSGIHKRRRG